MSETTAASSRTSSIHRKTAESDVEIDLVLDGSGRAEISTGIPYFDHMLHQLARHGGLDVVIRSTGDLAVDTHHTIEDTGIGLGKAFSDALGDRAGIRRFSSAIIPLDEALVEVVLDVSGRPFLHYDVETNADALPMGMPAYDPQLTEEFFRAFVTAAGFTMHVSLRYGKNTHHIIEAAFKAAARAIKDAVRIDGGGIPSTKGVI
ncbi:MAG TPA: imidazoleglycerol-phosphate dehydratase HisB [Acidimicrobiales bacterium]|jgi:imidazoleglycerol-phosphate dehydratase|nr:imidazoleglycerol-phosphate dehydratase HisB [Acidimicrobiales bacterium]